MAEVNIELFGGEQDGYRTTVDLRGAAPQVFYIWRAADTEKVTSATGKQRMVLADRLAVLAYRIDENSCRNSGPGRPELRYTRHAEADKALADPAL